MKSPSGWSEPGQTPEFDEYTMVLHGLLRVTTKNGEVDVAAGQALIAHSGEWVQYSTLDWEEQNTFLCVCRRFRQRRSTEISGKQAAFSTGEQQALVTARPEKAQADDPEGESPHSR